MLDYQLLLNKKDYIYVMKRIVQKSFDPFLIGIFIIGSILFFVQSYEMKRENKQLRKENEEFKDSLNRINIECYSIIEHSEIK